MWYNIFSATLDGLGFEIKTYDRCVAQNIIEGTQYTIFWYMDDNKLSHKDPTIKSDIINRLKKKIGDLSVVRENLHTFLGMKKEIKYNIIQVGVVEQLEECIAIFG